MVGYKPILFGGSYTRIDIETELYQVNQLRSQNHPIATAPPEESS